MILVLASIIAVFVAGAVCGIFATLVIGIHAEEHRAMRNRTDAPSRSGSASRHLLSTQMRGDFPDDMKAGR